MFSDLENHAATVGRVLIGTPGSLLQRENAAGFRFHARQYYDADGKKRERYVAGPVGDETADQVAGELRNQIEQANATIGDIRLLGREGFQIADARTFATLASLHNNGVFHAGCVLVGSHAFGVLLNQLGARAAAYATEDVDVARDRALAFIEPNTRSFSDMLADSGLTFVEVPALNHKQASTRWKEQGRSRFHIDLLVPSRDASFPVVPVPELKAHGQGIPQLRYLLAETHLTAMIAREGCCQVRVPAAERYAVHKLAVSTLRPSRTPKSEKDLLHAATLLAVLGEYHSGAIEAALRDVPRGLSRAVREGVARSRALLEMTHPRAWDQLQSPIGTG